MRNTDIAIVGGGLAGSTAAAMLGRAGIDAVVIDPHPVYPPDFRCEKLDGPQVAILEKTGLAGAVLRAATHDQHVCIARFGRLVQTRPSDQQGIFYDALVNAIRAEIPPGVELISAKVNAVATGSDRQRVTVSNGEEIAARLVVMANGLNVGLRHTLGIERDVISPCHSVSIGFNIKPRDRSNFDFPALTYYAERASDRIALLTLFPIGEAMRANLFCYRDMDDPWLARMRKAPETALFEVMPGLRRLVGDVEVTDHVKTRPVDLYVSSGHVQAGVVLVGDAFATSCPAAGTGTSKVFTDVERLCNVHIPNWLATPGMRTDKIAAFYDDPVKRACDAQSQAKAYFLRSLSIDPGFAWQARRWTRFLGQLGLGTVQHTRERLSSRPIERQAASL